MLWCVGGSNCYSIYTLSICKIVDIVNTSVVTSSLCTTDSRYESGRRSRLPSSSRIFVVSFSVSSIFVTGWGISSWCSCVFRLFLCCSNAWLLPSDVESLRPYGSRSVGAVAAAHHVRLVTHMTTACGRCWLLRDSRCPGIRCSDGRHAAAIDSTSTKWLNASAAGEQAFSTSSMFCSARA